MDENNSGENYKLWVILIIRVKIPCLQKENRHCSSQHEDAGWKAQSVSTFRSNTPTSQALLHVASEVKNRSYLEHDRSVASVDSKV